MKLIVGLGNPGDGYKNNRHNAGQMFIDYMVTLLHGHMVKKEKNYLTIQPSNYSAILLVKTLTFMNMSGQAVKKLSKVYGLKSNNLIVVHDDLDIPLGKFKIQKGVGPSLHNGIESIEKALGTKAFWRVRIGIDNRLALSDPEPIRSEPHGRRLVEGESTGWIDGETYVLQDFNPEEKKIVYGLFPKIYDRLKINFFT